MNQKVNQASLPGSDSVIVPAASTASAVSFFRSLSNIGVRSITVSPNQDFAAAKSRYCDEIVMVPSPQEDLYGYKQSLLSLAMRPDVQTIAPLQGEDIHVLSKYKEEFGNHINTVWPDFETIQTVHDRITLFERADKVGVPTPETKLLSEKSEWDEPSVIKPRFAVMASEYIESLDDNQMLEAMDPILMEGGHEPDNLSIISQMSHEPIVQEYIPGEEYTFRALYDNGEAIATTQKRMIRGQKFYRGTSVFHEAIDDPQFKRVGKAILDDLNWHGPVDMDFICDKNTGEYKLLELNPRFWSTLPLEIHSGINYPEYYYNLAVNNKEFTVPEPDDIKTHAIKGELLFIYSLLNDEHPLVEKPPLNSAITDIAKSAIIHRNFDLASVDDPKPFVYDIYSSMRELF